MKMDTSKKFSSDMTRNDGKCLKTYFSPIVEVVDLSPFCDNAMNGTVSLEKMELQEETEIGWDDDNGNVNQNSSLWED